MKRFSEPGESSSYEMQRKKERMLSELSKTSKNQTGHIFLMLTFLFSFILSTNRFCGAAFL